MNAPKENNKTLRRPYKVEQKPLWWLDNSYYFRYMIRESTSLIVLIYGLVIVVGLLRLTQGPYMWQGWVETVSSPLMFPLHLLALLAVVYHAYTWFKLAPRIMALRISGKPVSDQKVEWAHWIVMLGVTVACLLVASCGGALL